MKIQNISAFAAAALCFYAYSSPVFADGSVQDSFQASTDQDSVSDLGSSSQMTDNSSEEPGCCHGGGGHGGGGGGGHGGGGHGGGGGGGGHGGGGHGGGGGGGHGGGGHVTHIPVSVHHGFYPWHHWDHPYFIRPVFVGWYWDRLMAVTCTAEDSAGDLYPVTEDGYVGNYQNMLPQIEDAALDRCFSETGGDPGCQLAGCDPVY